ncbi:MAG: hypothetical protein ACI8RD_012590, partial [Bacillariaceae sp.]|jgi:hypothetical protein
VVVYFAVEVPMLSLSKPIGETSLPLSLSLSLSFFLSFFNKEKIKTKDSRKRKRKSHDGRRYRYRAIFPSIPIYYYIIFYSMLFILCTSKFYLFFFCLFNASCQMLKYPIYYKLFIHIYILYMS